MKRPFLLVHGAFRGGWSWARVRPGLVAAGHDVHAPSLPGCGERYIEGEAILSLDVWVDALERLVVAEDLHELVLVGHSQGGIVTAALAARVPERIAVLVHLDAAVLARGERAVDLTGMGGHLPPRDFWVPARPLVAAADLDEETAAWASARLTPTPMGPSLDVVPDVPEEVDVRTWFCSGTPQGFPSTVSRRRMDEAGLAYDVLDCGHDAPLVAPDRVVEALLAAADLSEHSGARPESH
ncbi:alpha/beta fold hydrolase [Nocardioides yefusunii]|uniref:Alpha/beta fold hydrolase n=1 Tax=Nocardioides yefusunii TaxID=2500546 RepID=A0ABW1QSD9_9ACTN|nr:alpha/beta hydrolase [Nocardioides yefusunii]